MSARSAAQRRKRVLKSEMIRVRVHPDHLKQLRDAAEAQHLDLSAWARQVLLREASEIAKPKP